MAAIAAISSIVFSRNISNSAKFSLHSNPLNLHICSFSRPNSIQNPLFPVNPIRIHPTTKPIFRICSIAESVAVEENTETIPQENQKRKLYIHNLPWTMTVVDIKNLFGECGTVVDVEIIKQKNGKSRGFAFVTMATGEEGQAAVEKFDAYEVSGRIIRVEYAKRLKKPPKPPLPEDPPRRETLHKLYLSNLAWKVRSSHLREFASAFNPVSARVVFASPGKSAGYGFVSFSTHEEAEAAILSLDGKELLNRAVRLKVSESKNEVEEDSSSTEKVESENKAEEDVSGRIIKVEFAKSLEKPPKSPLPEDPSRGETRHKLYVSNLDWKVRSTHLKEFASAFNPVSARVAFLSPVKSAGYGFVSFSTKEEAEAAIASLDGKELLNRVVRLRFSESKHEVEDATEKVESENKAEEVTEKVLSENEVQETIEEKLGDA